MNAVDTFINSRRFALAAGAARHKLPFIYSDVEYVMAGGLMAIGPGHYEGYYGAATYVAEGQNSARRTPWRPADCWPYTVHHERKSHGAQKPRLIIAFRSCCPRLDEWID